MVEPLGNLKRQINRNIYKHINIELCNCAENFDLIEGGTYLKVTESRKRKDHLRKVFFQDLLSSRNKDPFDLQNLLQIFHLEDSI